MLTLTPYLFFIYFYAKRRSPQSNPLLADERCTDHGLVSSHSELIWSNSDLLVLDPKT